MRIWWFAFGYFACYAPYSALTKAVTEGGLPGQLRAVSGFELLPLTVLASMVAMMAFLWLSGWWRAAGRRRLFGLDVPVPSRWTFLSGLCSATIIGTTTLAYTFSGTSIVFMMLLLRGGVLALAPAVDALTGRRVQWFSWVALALSLGALVVAFAEKSGFHMTLLAGVDVLAYLLAYFIRLRFMSRLAKSADAGANRRFFVEEHIVSSPALLLFLGIGALIGGDGMLGELRRGFTELWATSGVVWEAILIGVLSEGTGVFGGLILLDKRENTFCVPVNRSSSILAGVAASLGLSALRGDPVPSGFELVGAGMIIGAIVFLTVPPMIAKRRALLRA